MNLPSGAEQLRQMGYNPPVAKRGGMRVSPMKRVPLSRAPKAGKAEDGNGK